MSRTVDVASAWASSIFMGGAGMTVRSAGKQPAKLLELYEFEACPFCRKVRVALTALDLDAMIYPCPRNGPRYRPEVQAQGGKAQFPYLIDPNTGTRTYESDDIVQYLVREYGGGAVPLSLRLGPVTLAAFSAASLARVRHGGAYRPSRPPEKPLELWSFEASPYCRLAREALCELELPYVLHNVGKGSPRRPDFIARSGRMMVPYLADPNTGKEMFESADIVRYLTDTYAA